MRYRQVTLAILAIALCFSTCGCGQDKLPAYPTTIRVRLPNGHPVPGARVILRSMEKSIIAKGIADDDGVALMTTHTKGDGAVEGPHAAAIGPPVVEGDLDERRDRLSFAPRFARFDSSKLVFTVVGDGSANDFEVILTPD